MLTMRLLIWTTVILCLSGFLLCTEFDPEDIWKDYYPRIVSGIKVTNRSYFPYQASIRYRGRHFCGGVLYSTDSVISAAHCFQVKYWSKSRMRVVVGDLNLDKETENTRTYKIDEIISHDRYNRHTALNDVAIIKINGSFEWNEFVAPLKLSTKPLLPNTTCVVSGWGTTGSRLVSRDLLYDNVTINDNSTCKKFIERRVKYRPGMICAIALEYKGSTCKGDSGGPLVCNRELSGIVSWGIKCGIPGNSDVYADVWYYRKWFERGRSTLLALDYVILSLLTLVQFLCNIL